MDTQGVSPGEIGLKGASLWLMIYWGPVGLFLVNNVDYNDHSCLIRNERSPESTPTHMITMQISSMGSSQKNQLEG